MWQLVVHSTEKSGLSKTTKGSLWNGILYKVKLTYLKNYFLLYMPGRMKRNTHHPFTVNFGYMQLQSQVSLKYLSFIHRITVVFLLWIKRKGQKFLIEFWMKEKNSWLIEIEAYMTHSCLWGMYQLLKKYCGDIIRREMTF